MDKWFENQYSERSNNVPPSFIREILKVTNSPDVISFAGGLPNPSFFPIDKFKLAATSVLENNGKKALQYATTEGDPDLRAYISKHYKEKYQLDVAIDEIIITSGSQQGLDLIAKLFINEGDTILMESPTYLGAIQCFSQYKPQWAEVLLENDGIDLNDLQKSITSNSTKLMYAIPNFQNPSGTCYSETKRIEMAKILKSNKILLIEDDPYGALDFDNSNKTPIKKLYKEGTLLMGSFSKIVAPSLRLGWIVAEKEIISKLTILKQASDLHSNYLSQLILLDYLKNNNLDAHIKSICTFYKEQAEWMQECIQKYFPTYVSYIKPKGGMFLWLDFTEKIDVRTLLKACMEEEKVVFVPGDPFYITQSKGKHKARFNFSNGSKEKIEEGIKKIAKQLNNIK